MEAEASLFPSRFKKGLKIRHTSQHMWFFMNVAVHISNYQEPVTTYQQCLSSEAMPSDITGMEIPRLETVHIRTKRIHKWSLSFQKLQTFFGPLEKPSTISSHEKGVGGSAKIVTKGFPPLYCNILHIPQLCCPWRVRESLSFICALSSWFHHLGLTDDLSTYASSPQEPLQ